MQNLETPKAPAAAPAALFDAMLDDLRGRVRSAEAELVIRFARLFYATATPEFFVDRTPAMLAAIGLSAWRHLEASAPTRADVSVTDPEQESEPWSAPVTVIRTHVAEAPFIVGTIREYLHGRQLHVQRFLHPVLQVVRQEDGSILSIGPGSAGAPLESIVHCEVPQIGDSALIDEVREQLRIDLDDVVVVTTDFGPSLEAVNDTVLTLDQTLRRLPERELEVREVQEFLRWLRPNFVFLAYQEEGLVDSPDERGLADNAGLRLGFARQPHWTARIGLAAESASQAPPSGGAAESADVLRWPPRLLTILQTSAESTVHRLERMHNIAIRTVDADNNILGVRHFFGLFRARAYQEEAEQIPILRHKLRRIVEEAGWREGSHNHREAIKIFNSMPKEELFRATSTDIGREIEAILTQYYTHEVKVTLRGDEAGRTMSAMVIMPRDRYSARARRGIEAELVRLLGATILNTNLVMGGGEQARLHFQLETEPGRLKPDTTAQLEQRVRDLIQTWGDLLERRLGRSHPAGDAKRLAQQWAQAFSLEYQAANTPDDAVADIGVIEAMEAAGRTVDVRLGNPEAGSTVADDVTLLKVYLRGARLVLSDVMPVLENAGLRVLSMSPFDAADSTFVYVFAVQDAEGRRVDLEARGLLLAEALLAAGAGETTDDALNALVLTAGLAWREVDVLRAYCEYAFQLGLAPARIALTGTLRAQPGAARLLIELFNARFDPAAAESADERERRLDSSREAFFAQLEQVTSLADDRALRQLLALIDATVRTNYFVHGGVRPTARSGGVPYISFKFLSERLQSLVPSRLRVEVWVQSARMAGIHLRRGPVSRGGIRYSDRPNDLRTEVLGLVRTQSVKNSVIVPAGSKGGFVVRRQHSDPKKQAAEVEAQYRTLIRGLLDITDNLVADAISRPAGLVAHDDADPYLVVAADKGTATYSDVANEVSAEYNFWLDDAFASGGSNGYDHKREGITARGAWECVRRHFREMGRDTQTEPFTVVGIGDMSGDVFGNGMLLSREIRLVAAFNHRHIFVDPTPDAASTFQERQRLFHMGPSGWNDYNTALLSPGGFVVPRGIKSIELSPEAKAALGVVDGEERMDGETLVRTILRAPVDLLWNGGIGTYVKAPEERHADAGDSANDAVRIDATELRARVLGEGGNLGLTQRARVTYALNGGRCYTDAIDNSGGVDMSDREVNLKILLNAATAEGRLDTGARNVLLRELTDAVTDKVLHDNWSQSLGISLDARRAPDGVDDFHRLMVALERNRVMDRAGEALPSLEVLDERRANGLSLTRPELAVLLAYAKLTLKPALVASPLLDDPAMDSYMAAYFPDRAVQAAGEDALAGHRLRRDIIATQLANEMLDLMGVSFLHRMTRDTGQSEAAVARAWFIAARLSGAPELRARLAELEGQVHTDIIYRWLLGLARVLERTSRWILANVPADAPIDSVIEQYLDGLRALRGDFRAIVVGSDRQLYEERVAEARALTDREDLAASIITLRFFDQLMEILTVAQESGRPAVRVGCAYYLASEQLDVPWLRAAIYAAAGESRWDQRVAQTVDEDLGRAHRALTMAVVTAGSDDAPVEQLVAEVSARHAAVLDAFRILLDDIAADDKPSLSALLIAVRELGALE